MPNYIIVVFVGKLSLFVREQGGPKQNTSLMNNHYVIVLKWFVPKIKFLVKFDCKWSTKIIQVNNKYSVCGLVCGIKVTLLEDAICVT